MRKWTMLLGAVLFTFAAIVWSTPSGAADEAITIGQVMKDAMKGGLCKKVVEGQADKAQKEQLLAMFKGLAAAEPPAGDEASWKSKTGALVTAAQAAVDGKGDASDLLKKAANCKACHDVHKGQ